MQGFSDGVDLRRLYVLKHSMVDRGAEHGSADAVPLLELLRRQLAQDALETSRGRAAVCHDHAS